MNKEFHDEARYELFLIAELCFMIALTSRVSGVGWGQNGL